PLVNNWDDRRNRIVLAILLGLATASDQLTAVLALSLISVRVMGALRERNTSGAIFGLETIAPSALLFLSIVYAGVESFGLFPLRENPLVPQIDAIQSVLGFLAFAFLPIAPLFILGIRKGPDRNLAIWSLLCLA